MEFAHQPVMAREVCELLGGVPAGLVVDATVGGGGHAGRLLAARPDLRLLGIDRDGDAVAAARERLAEYGDRARVVRGGFDEIATIVAGEGEGNIMGVLFDLGVSSPQLDRAARGFSYMADAPLDMRMDTRQELTAATVVNEYDEDALAGIIATYGEERFARRIARRIVAARPIATTGELVEAITAAIPAPARRRGPHPARRTFQALRIEVNREIECLTEGLEESVHLLAPEGRVLVLAYHSLEDRIVKERFRAWSATHEPALPGLPAEPVARSASVRLLTRRAWRPTEEEVAANPRARSVRLRAAEKLARHGVVHRAS
ncbi:MAG: 16S rRNA (cytosine(1402)-N(4))-methyltransferase RsmH [Actinobacteria bacterium]|nr:16S rRNA (cytosine(1402)-N(4))-methyltransferase RsmH [Actinomycetota bacterium]